MTLISLLLGLIIEWFVAAKLPQRHLHWFNSYVGFLRTKFSDVFLSQGQWAYVLLLLPLLLIVGIIQYLIDGVWLGLFELLFAIAIFWYCIDVHKLKEQVDDYRSAVNREDHEQAKDIAQEFLDEPVADELSALNTQVSNAIFVQSNQRLFGVIFWFAILGPLGAILYRLNRSLVTLVNEDSDSYEKLSTTTRLVQQLLDWLPARIAAFSYLLIGDFMAGFTLWWDNLFAGLADNDNLLAKTGSAARKADSDEASLTSPTLIDSSVTIVRRATVVWLVVIAIFTLGAWIY